ncbi:hypothetical protein SDC9_150360 [bioreactor metagenome]|uniref:Uncharacterized protein n=1 Tax=bioreactor metagenome TaxID=1076179 RepID=A0A645EMV2_9ZZZZ
MFYINTIKHSDYAVYLAFYIHVIILVDGFLNKVQLVLLIKIFIVKSHNRYRKYANQNQCSENK